MRIQSLVMLISFVFITGCSVSDNHRAHETLTNNIISTPPVPGESLQSKNHPPTEEPPASQGRPQADMTPFPHETPAQDADIKPSAPIITEMDWSDYFDGINGAAVIYDPKENNYDIYNPGLAGIRRSPCSTFKIISSLTALDQGIIAPDESVRRWSGEVFWNDGWNKDIGFKEAFRSSCIWYFREVIDEIGKEKMQLELNKLSYGNCDISDWAGTLNTNNNNRSLTGFWVESSLKISPKEQTEVMERIFGSNTGYRESIRDQLKEVMLVTEETSSELLIYGKTGMGKAEGIVVDSWFTGFSETADKTIYFCVYLGETEGKNVSSTKAKEIAIKLVSNYR